jgi:hypothetical protein
VKNIGGDSQIVEDEVGGRHGISGNTADSGRGYEHILRPGVREEPLNRALIRQIEVGVASKDEIIVPGRAQTSD